MSTLYTALLFAEKQCQKHNVPVAPITFDCSLYMKSAEIIAACSDEFQHTFARLGGFHWLMSAKGAIGYIMAGSRIEDLFSIVYAKGSVPHLMTGHDYTRSFRAHLLSSTVLISHLIDESGVALTNHGDTLSSLMSKNIEVNQLMELESVQLLVEAIKVIIQEDHNDSRTLKLWKAYLRMTHLLRLFLFAERTGDFDLHIYCMEQYIPLFHSARHFNYAKATRLYVPQMKNLKHNIPEDTYDLYAGKGYILLGEKIFILPGIPQTW